MKNIQLANSTILITGTAGFIGANLALELLKAQSPVHIIGIDNLNDYYDISIKEYRLKEIEKLAAKRPGSTWIFIEESIAEKQIITDVFKKYKPDIVVNLAAQAGVRLRRWSKWC